MATSKADECRAKAREAEQLAERTTDSTIKEQARKIAQEWWEMVSRGKGRRTETASLLMLVLRSAGPIRACGTAGGHGLKVGVNDDVHHCANASGNKVEFLGGQLALIGQPVLFRHG